jgi:hypothetical protein
MLVGVARFQHKSGIKGEYCPTKGDASIPTPLHPAPAPTRQEDHVSLAHDLCWNHCDGLCCKKSRRNALSRMWFILSLSHALNPLNQYRAKQSEDGGENKEQRVAVKSVDHQCGNCRADNLGEGVSDIDNPHILATGTG